MKEESPDLLRVREINERKEAMKNQEITEAMIEQWMGGDNLSVDNFLELLADVINGTYPVEVLKEEVIDYAIQEEN